MADILCDTHHPKTHNVMRHYDFTLTSGAVILAALLLAAADAPHGDTDERPRTPILAYASAPLASNAPHH